jgi:hypothetical protein
MSTQTFNVNPTIFAPSAQSFRDADADDLWPKDPNSDSDIEEEDSTIDSQEVFGETYPLYCTLLSI